MKDFSLKIFIFSSIRSKLLLSFFLVITVSIIFVTIFPISTYSDRLVTNNIKYSNQVISNYIGNINTYLGEIEKISDTIQYNFYIQRYLIDKNTLNETGAIPLTADQPLSDYYQGSTDALSSIIDLRSDVRSIFIHDKDGIALSKSRYKSLDFKEIYQSTQSLLKSPSINIKQGHYTIGNAPYYESSFKTFTFLKNLERYDGQGDIGTIQIDTDMSVVKKYGDSVILNEGGFLLVIDGQNNTLYQSTMEGALAETQPNTSSFANQITSYTTEHSNNENFIKTINNNDYLFVYKHIPETNWLVATITPYNIVLTEANEIRNSIILITLISLIIILTITYIIATQITKPIIALKKSMDVADHNHFNDSTLVEVTSHDEIGDLSTSFNHMMIRIKGLMAQLVQEQEEKRNAELKVLQDQVNPHFLYNTLDTIIWMTESGDKNTVPMIEALSQLFRISLSKGQEFITIEQELNHIRHYLYILQFRYLDKFDYSIQIDPTLIAYKVPKIILQPLIENAIYHGIKNTSVKGFIAIDVHQKNNDIVISITDNGIGMDTETCQKLLDETQEQESQNGSGVGIRNVNQRIKLYYGNNYGLSYKSSEGKGTIVTMTLPTFPLK